MSNSKYLFPKILEFASSYGMPVDKKRGILREYYQARIIQKLYAKEDSKNLSFIGGTALRLLRNIDRFSEDLDFDVVNGIINDQIRLLVQDVAEQLRREGEEVDVKVAEKGEKFYFELKFPNILFDLGLTGQEQAILMIKLDYSRNWKGQTPQNILMNRYGYLTTVKTNPSDQLIVQKLTAYVQRELTQPRDLYDVVWLFAQGAHLDKDFMHVNKLDDILERAKEKFATEGVKRGWEGKLQPFLFNATDTQKLAMFGEVLSRLK